MAVTRALPLAVFIAAFGNSPGVLPRRQVLGSSRADWPRIFNLIEEQGWAMAWNRDGRAVVLTDLDDPSRYQESFALRPIPRRTDQLLPWAMKQ